MYTKHSYLQLLEILNIAADDGYNFIYCHIGQNVPDAILCKQFTVSGFEADKLGALTQEISDWQKEMRRDIEQTI